MLESSGHVSLVISDFAFRVSFLDFQVVRCRRFPASVNMTFRKNRKGLWDPIWDRSQGRRPVSAGGAKMDVSLCTF